MTNTSQAPVPPTSSSGWMETVPTDWESYLALRDAAANTHATRESLRDWLGKQELDAATRGIGLAAAGDWRGALPLLDEASGDLPRLLAGLAWLTRGRPRAALARLESLVDSPAVGGEARRARIRAHVQLRDVEALASDRAQLRSVRASAADQRWAEGLALELDGDHEGAAAAWQGVLAEEPGHVDATFSLAELLGRRGDEDAATPLYEGFLSGRLPRHAGALMNLGMAYEDRDDPYAASRCFQLVVSSDPQSARARAYLRDARASSHQVYDEGKERRVDKQNAVLRIPVTDFELSVRARNCLQRMNIHTLGDLVCRTEPDLLAFKNFGETSLQEVKDILAVKGLRLGMHPSELEPEEAPTGLAALAPNGDVSLLKISELDLSVRARAALATLGITSVAELMETTEMTLLSCKNFGQTSLDEIKTKLYSINLTLAE